MKIILYDEKHDKEYKKILIGKNLNWFYELPDEIDLFFEELEEEYNCTLDFTGRKYLGSEDLAKWTSI